MPTDLERDAASRRSNRVMMNVYFTSWAGSVDQHFASRMFFSALVVARIPCCLRSTFSSGHFRQEGDRTQLFDCATAKKLAALSTVCNGTLKPSSRSSQSRAKSTNIAQRVARHAQHQDRSAQVHHSDVGDQSGSTARTALSTKSFNIKTVAQCCTWFGLSNSQQNFEQLLNSRRKMVLCRVESVRSFLHVFEKRYFLKLPGAASALSRVTQLVSRAYYILQVMSGTKRPRRWVGFWHFFQCVSVMFVMICVNIVSDGLHSVVGCCFDIFSSMVLVLVVRQRDQKIVIVCFLACFCCWLVLCWHQFWSQLWCCGSGRNAKLHWQAANKVNPALPSLLSCFPPLALHPALLPPLHHKKTFFRWSQESPFRVSFPAKTKMVFRWAQERHLHVSWPEQPTVEKTIDHVAHVWSLQFPRNFFQTYCFFSECQKNNRKCSFRLCCAVLPIGSNRLPVGSICQQQKWWVFFWEDPIIKNIQKTNVVSSSFIVPLRVERVLSLVLWLFFTAFSVRLCRSVFLFTFPSCVGHRALPQLHRYSSEFPQFFRFFQEVVCFLNKSTNLNLVLEAWKKKEI